MLSPHQLSKRQLMEYEIRQVKEIRELLKKYAPTSVLIPLSGHDCKFFRKWTWSDWDAFENGELEKHVESFGRYGVFLSEVVMADVDPNQKERLERDFPEMPIPCMRYCIVSNVDAFANAPILLNAPILVTDEGHDRLFPQTRDLHGSPLPEEWKDGRVNLNKVVLLVHDPLGDFLTYIREYIEEFALQPLADPVEHAAAQPFLVHAAAQPLADPVVHALAQPPLVHAEAQPPLVHALAQPPLVHAAAQPLADPVVHALAQPPVVHALAQPPLVHAAAQPLADPVVHAAAQPPLVHALAQPPLVHAEAADAAGRKRRFMELMAEFAEASELFPNAKFTFSVQR
jgi:hypothetical protein